MVSILQYPAEDLSNHALLQELFAATAAEHSSEDLGRGHMSASWARRSAQWSSAIGQLQLQHILIYLMYLSLEKTARNAAMKNALSLECSHGFGECFTPQKV